MVWASLEIVLGALADSYSDPIILAFSFISWDISCPWLLVQGHSRPCRRRKHCDCWELGMLVIIVQALCCGFSGHIHQCSLRVSGFPIYWYKISAWVGRLWSKVLLLDMAEPGWFWLDYCPFSEKVSEKVTQSPLLQWSTFIKWPNRKHLLMAPATLLCCHNSRACHAFRGGDIAYIRKHWFRGMAG